MKLSQNNKYQWIVDNCNINSNSKVLELGFGKLDLMKYIRDKKTGATVHGVNISTEQLRHAAKEGFKCFNISHQELHKNVDKLDKYDVIINNGSFEYLVNGTNQQT